MIVRLNSILLTMMLTLVLSSQAGAQKIEDIDPADSNYADYSAIMEAIFVDYSGIMRCQISPVSLLRSEEAANKPTLENAKNKGHCILDPAEQFCVEESDDSSCFTGRVIAIATTVKFRSKMTRAKVSWGFHALPDGETLDAIAITQYRMQKNKKTGAWKVIDRVYSWTMSGLSKK